MRTQAKTFPILILTARGNWQASPEVRLDVKVDNLLDKTFTRALYSYDGNYYGYREERRNDLTRGRQTCAIGRQL